MEISPTSEGRSIALIEFDGTVMRYAGVRADADSSTLFKLGACEFDFDAENALLEDGREGGVTEASKALPGTITQALDEVFGGATLSDVRVVVHPRNGITAYSLAPVETDEEALGVHFGKEISLLAGESEPDLDALTVTPATATNVLGAAHRWHHLSYLPSTVWSRLKSFKTLTDAKSLRVLDSSIAASQIEVGPATSDSVALFVGIYPRRTEVSVTKGERWLRSHHSDEGGSEDIAYCALDALRTVGLLGEDVHIFGFYGKDVDAQRLDLLASFFPVEPRRINPFEGAGASVAVPEEEASAFVPLMGAIRL